MRTEPAIHDHIPDSIYKGIRSVYHRIAAFFNTGYKIAHPKRRTNKQLHNGFVETTFDSQSEYQKYVREFEEGPVAKIRDEALDKYQLLTGGDSSMGGISLDTARDYYCITRKIQPETVIETGVCNGLSTLSVLLAINKNEYGQLHSIDYPYRADESLEEFRDDTFESYGGAAIPSDKEPSWIIPGELRDHWELIIGKSQKELPKLVTRVDNFDVFIHDSEHSHPCMMFEYELACEWLNQEGIVLSDDITWNEAFDIFTHVRNVDRGKLSENVGYMRKID
ncbi:class I SAM-dependent methyltransferase [Halorubrum rutilum]|uniref:Class I SAM-dependent methyltransferase n=1 Tax=Halorubrum rutilum TaxID=1364933 RepID=A0ABD6AIQ7_9EURY|nr:class I SAM-dependent methyltransferase [Halorubrum rutilum]